MGALSPICDGYCGHGLFVLEPLGDPLQRLTEQIHTLTEYDVCYHGWRI